MRSNLPGAAERDLLDVHIGRRAKERREALLLSPTDVSAYIKTSKQQLRKYETGENRISAARLYWIARCLNVSVEFFYQDLDTTGLTPR